MKKLILVLVGASLAMMSCEKTDGEIVPSSQVESVDEASNERRAPITAEFTPTVRIINNQAFVSFVNRSRFASTFEWSFPGGSPASSTSRNPQTIYNQNGTFEVTLVSSRRGRTATVTKEVVVTGLDGGIQEPSNDVLPNNNQNDQAAEVVARFNTTLRNVGGQAILTVNNGSTNAETFQWSFPGGIPATSTERNPVVTYPRSGNFTVTLVASNGNQVDRSVQEIAINEAAPTLDQNVEDQVDNVQPQAAVDVRASFFVSVIRRNGQFELTMRNRSRNATDFQWSFPGGDPETSTEKDPTVRFTEGGLKTITLVASNGDVSATRTIDVIL